MKAFSRILGTIVLFFVAFFLIGVFVPSVSYDIEIEIDRPANEVFPALTDSELSPKWIRGLISSALVHGEVGKPGSKYTMTIDRSGRAETFEETIIQSKPDSILVYSMESQGLLGNVVIKLQKHSESTRVFVSTTLRGKVWFTRSFLPLFKKSIKDTNLKDYLTLKSVLEST